MEALLISYLGYVMRVIRICGEGGLLFGVWYLTGVKLTGSTGFMLFE